MAHPSRTLLGPFPQVEDESELLPGHVWVDRKVLLIKAFYLTN